MAAVELATAYVTLAVDSSQIGKQIGKGFAGGDKIATRSGRTMGASMRKAFTASKPLDVGSATKKLEDAQNRLAVHTERSASRQKKAQENVAAARQRVADVATKSSEKVTSAQEKVESAEEHLARVTEQSSRDQASAKRQVELAQAKYNDTVSKYGAESTQALGAANRLADAEDRLARVTSDGAAKQEAAKRKVADAQEQYSKAVKESGEDSEAARKAADNLSTAEQQLEAAAMEAANGHEKLSTEVTEAKNALDQAQRSTKGLRGAWGKAKDLGADYKGMGDRLNAAIGPKVWKGVKWGALGAAGAVTGVLGGALVKGWGRLTSIENAEAKLTGLGHSGEEVASIMDNALASVKGTSFGLDEAAGLAGTLVASGIQPGKDLERTLSLVSDSATIAGRDLGDMGLIWSSVAAKGKLQGDDAMQLLSSGVPIWQMVADVMGVTAAEAQELGSKGQVSFEIFREAMEKGVGGAAQEAGKTTQGAFKNMGAALSRFGAAILKDIYPLIGPVFGQISDLFDYLADIAGPAMEKLVGNLKPFVSGLQDVWNVLATGDFTGSIFGFEEDSAFVDFLFTLRETAIVLYEKALVPLGEWFAKHWKPIAAALAGLAAFFGGSMIVSAVASLIAPFTTLVSVLGGVLPAIGAIIAAVNWWLVAAAALSAFLGYFFTQTETGKNIVAGAWKAMQKAVAVVVDFFNAKVWPALVTGWEVLKRVVNAVWTGAIKPIFTAIGNLAMQVWNGVVVPALKQFGGYVRDTMMPIISRLWTDYVKPAFTAIGALAVWLWHNAIKPAVSLLTAYWTNVLGPVIVWLWKNVVSPAFSAIGAIIAFAWNNVIFPALDLLKAFITNVLAPSVVWLWKNVFQPAWKGIQAAVSATVDWVTGTAWPALKKAWDGIAAAATWLWRNVFQPVWTGIKLAVAVAVTAVLAYIDLMKLWFTKVIAPVALWLYRNVILPAWNGIKAAIGAVVNWFTGTAWPLLRTAWNAVAKAATWLWKSVLAPAWAGIKSAINAVVQWFLNSAWPVIRRTIDLISAGFRTFRDFLSRVWSFIRDRIIKPVVTWFRDTVWPLFSRVIGKIQDKFAWFRDKLKGIWSYIKNTIIKPVVDWFADTVKPKIDTFTSNVKDAFNTLKDNVLKAWDGIKNGMKKPINGVIEIYNKHIAGNFNKVADTLKLDKKYRLANMATFHRGGYTGPGAKYKEAGVVHADEYVIRKESQNDISRRAPGFLDALNRFGSKALGYAGGGKVLRGWRQISKIPHEGMSITSTVRRGAKTAGTGSVSKHALGLAVDFAGAADKMKQFFTYVRKNYSVSELIHTPMRGQQLSRGGVPRATFPPATARSHYNHVHVGGWGPGEKIKGAISDAIGGIDLNPFDGLWSKIKGSVANKVGGGPVGGIVSKVAQNTVTGVKDWVAEKILEGSFDEFIDYGKDAGKGFMKSIGYGVYKPIAEKALSMTGNLNEANLTALMRRMNQESGYNPRAINNWDSNAKKGTPSKGLMQVIQPTFNAYKDSRAPNNIWSPLANILASIHYTKSRYGSLTRGWNRKGGYAEGGLVTPYLHDKGGWHSPGDLSLNMTRRPEAVLTDAQWATMSRLAEQNLTSEGGIHIGEVHGYSAEEVADEIEKKRRRAAALRVPVGV